MVRTHVLPIERLRFAFLLAALVALSLVATATMSAQVITDPNDRIYADIDRWYNAGYIDRMPPIRPYPLPVVRELLKQVEDRGGAQDRAAAKRYLESMAGGFQIHPSVEEVYRLQAAGPASDTALAAGVGGAGSTDTYSQTSFGLSITAAPMDLLSIAGKLHISLLSSDPFTALPAGTYPTLDYLSDWADIPFFGGIDLAVRQGLTTDVTVGTADLYFQSGTLRTDYGPIFGNGIVFGGQSRPTPRFNLHWGSKYVALDILYLELTATGANGGGAEAGKHLSFHSAHFYPTDWLTLSAFETAVWGPRFDLSYFVPLSEFYLTQGLGGFADNSIVGLSASARLPYNTGVSGVLYIDDLNFNQVVRFNFDTKWKLAYEVEAHWTPMWDLFRQVKLDYTAVMPYMYTHEGGDPNYTNYTNAGLNLGPALEPNSDRLTITASFAPLPQMEVGLMGRLIRHGNASAGTGVKSPADGSLFDTGYTSSGGYAFQNSTPFLSQSVIEKTLQFGFDADYRFSRFDAKLSYMYQYTWNAGLVAGANVGNHLIGMSFGYSY
ncbi:hypothetical protein [Salinispira pacifica]